MIALVSISIPAVAVPPGAPRIESVVLSAQQPHGSNPSVIWYDNFDVDRLATYLEPSAGSPDARRSLAEGLGGAGASMECHYPKGGRGVGNRKLVFGDCPFGKPLRKSEKFSDIYWRFYVKHQRGWTGTPAKLTRATGFVSSAWNQAFISHVWSSGLPLTLDPASGVVGGAVVTTVYNDFDHLHWLGNKPVGRFPIHATQESGRWVCVESRVKLNTPGQKDGTAELWVDGVLDSARSNLDFVGTYTGRGSSVNAIFLEAYWNEGSPVDQYRWYDDFVVSTHPIGPLTADANPTLIRLPDPGVETWEIQVAAESDGSGRVWESRGISAAGTRVRVDSENGTFVGVLANASALPAGPMYFCRARQRTAAGEWSEWSRWHQPFLVSGQSVQPRLQVRRDAADRGFTIELLGENAAAYVLESATDLREWTRVGEVHSRTGWCAWPFGETEDLTHFFRARLVDDPALRPDSTAQ